MNLAQSIDSPACKLTAPKTLDFRIKYKTQKCRYWQQQGYCPYGQMCAFVHDQLEKRYKGQIHEHYKTKPCSNFSKNCYCKYGDRCLFLHGQNCTDRERTRSNSPAEDQAAPKAPGKHQQNLKMLAEFGLSVFQAYMQRSHSYVLSLRDAEQCNWSSSSTEPDMLNNQFYGHNYYFMGDELVDHSLHAQERKSRMYSL